MDIPPGGTGSLCFFTPGTHSYSAGTTGPVQPGTVAPVGYITVEEE